MAESDAPDSRDALRAYLIAYAKWAVCGEGEKPDPPIGFNLRVESGTFNTRVETAPRLREVDR